MYYAMFARGCMGVMGIGVSERIRGSNDRVDNEQ